MIHRCSLLAFLILSAGRVHAQISPGQHASAGRAIESQKEGDWADNRWSRTDIGLFLASNLEVPGGKVAKALSIKVGAGAEGSVCYDTATCTLRAGWLDGFLKLDPARFGLVVAPRVAGRLAFGAPTRAGWRDSQVRYRGFHVRGQRMVLEYSVGAMSVLDSPWLIRTNGLEIFTRSLELGPSPDVASLMLMMLPEGSPSLKLQPHFSLASVRVGTNAMAVAIRGAGVVLLEEKRHAWASLPKGDQRRRAQVLFWKGSDAQLAAFEEWARTAEPEDLTARLAEPAAPRWLPELKTVGQRGLDTTILSVDTLTVPYDNPWHALLFLSGVDFTPDGACYVCSIHGDVWRVTGVDDSLHELKWKRFATGLFQALGLKVRDGQVYVLGRDQITRLHDKNGDGEADFYENFCNLIDTSTEGHDFVTSLEKDDAGNFYYVDPQGAFRVAPDGSRQEKLATGFRNANGLGASPDGRIITVAPQQGNWTPSSFIAEIRPGGHYGYGGPRFSAERPLGYDAPLCWIPHSVDNSSGSQVWVPSGHWGPLGGQMLHLLWGRCGLMLVLRDSVAGQPQGAVVPLPGRFLSGPNRGSFHARDGHLYIAGSTGWQTSAVKDGALHRVRFTGKPVYLPVACHAHSNGLTLTFSQELQRAPAEDPGSYALQQWNYRYAAQYGSKDWSVLDPTKEGRDPVEVKSARLLPDRRTVFLESPGLRPVMQMEVKYNVDTTNGNAMRGSLWLTLNKLDAEHR